MGLFDLFSKSKSDVEIYLEKRNQEHPTNIATHNIMNGDYDGHHIFRIAKQEFIDDHYIAVSGLVIIGWFQPGEAIDIVKDGEKYSSTIYSIKQFGKKCDYITERNMATIILNKASITSLNEGDLIMKPGKTSK